MKGKTLVSMSTALVATALFVVAAAAGQSAKEAPAKEDLRVDLNHAGLEELVELPGIGEQVAKRILDYREKNGPFETTEELMNVRGIGEKTYLKLEPYLTLGGEKDKRKK